MGRPCWCLSGGKDYTVGSALTRNQGIPGNDMTDALVVGNLWEQHLIPSQVDPLLSVKPNICGRPRLPDLPCLCSQVRSSHQAAQVFMCVFALCFVVETQASNNGAHCHYSGISHLPWSPPGRLQVRLHWQKQFLALLWQWNHVSDDAGN